MKKNYLLLLAAFIVLVGAGFQNVSGQTQTVGTSSAYHYNVAQQSVTGVVTFQWAIYDAANTAPAGAGVATFDATNTATTRTPDITWNTPGTYTLRAREDRNGCQGSTRTLTVTVVTQPTIVISTGDQALTCATSTAINLTVAYTNIAAIVFPLSVTYQVDGVTAGSTLTITNAAQTTLTLPTTFGENATAIDVTNRTFTIVSVADAATASVALGADYEYKRSIYATPGTGIINY